MIKAYVYINNVWRRIYNTENISLTAETGGRIPTFSFSLPDKDFRYSIFNTASPYSQYLKKGNQVKITIDDKTVAKGFINDIKYQYPDQIITVQCNGTLSKLQEDVFGGEDWSYESGSFETAIPSSKYIDLSSTGATTVFDVKVNGSYLFSYEWNVTEKKLVIPSDVSGTITGKYFSTVSPHKYFEAILSGYDYALVPLLNGSDTYRLNKLNLASGADLGNVGDDLTGTGEVITRPIDLGRYTTGFGGCSFNEGDFTVEVRGGDTRKILALEGWQPLNNGQNLNSIFARFVRFIQFKITLNNASLDYIDIRLIGNAPNVSGIKFEDVNKFNALQKLAECYQCYLFEDRLGTLRMEHKEIAEDWEEYLPYLQFTNMEVSGIYSPKRVVVNGLEQRFTWLTGDMKGTECIIKCKGAIEFLDEDLVGEIVIDNKCAWDEASLANVALCYQPPRTIIKLNTNRDWELGDLIRVQTNYLEAEKPLTKISYMDVSNFKVFYVDVNDTVYPYVSNVLLETNGIYRVSARMFRDELSWDYELEEVYRFPAQFTNLYEYDFIVGFDFGTDIVLPIEPDIIYVWDGEDWTTPDYDYNPDTGEVTIPNIPIDLSEEELIPDIPINEGEPIPEHPIVVVYPPSDDEFTWTYPTEDDMYPYYVHWDIFQPHILLQQQGFDLNTQYDVGIVDRDFEADPDGIKTLYSDHTTSTRKFRIGTVLKGDNKVTCYTEVYFNNWRGESDLNQFCSYIWRAKWEAYEEFKTKTDWGRILNIINSNNRALTFTSADDYVDVPFFVDKMYEADGTQYKPPSNQTFYADVFFDGVKGCTLRIDVRKTDGQVTTTIENKTLDSALFASNKPFHTLKVVPQWSEDYYAVLVGRGRPSPTYYYGITYYTNKDWEYVNRADGVWWLNPGFKNSENLHIDKTSPWIGNKFDYFFKAWRGITVDMSLRCKYSQLDPGAMLSQATFEFFHFGDSKERGAITFKFIRDHRTDDYFGINYSSPPFDGRYVIRSLDNWLDVRLVLLGKLKYLDLQQIGEDYPGFDLYTMGNYENYKDAHERKCYYKRDPDFQNMMDIYLNGELVFSGTWEEMCNWYYETPSIFLSDYIFNFEFNGEGWCPSTEGWYMRRLKITDMALRPYKLPDGSYADIREVV